MARRNDRVTAVSQAVARHYEEHLSVKPDAIIPDAIPRLAAELAGGQDAQKAENARLRIALPGRITREKGHFVAIQALSQLASTGHEFDIEILGGGPLAEQLSEQVSASGLAERVVISGMLSHKSFLRRLMTKDICLVPSLQEGLGIVALEAMQLGVPVIASDVGGLSETIRHRETGLLVLPGNADALAAACAELLHDQGYRKSLAAAAREHVQLKYAMEVIGPRWMEVYESLLTGVIH